MKVRAYVILLLASFLITGTLAGAVLAGDSAERQEYTVRYLVFVGTPPDGHKNTDKISEDIEALQLGVPVELSENELDSVGVVKSFLPGYKIEAIVHGTQDILVTEALSSDSSPAATLLVGKTKDKWGLSLSDEFALRRKADGTFVLSHRGKLVFSNPDGSAEDGLSWDLVRTVGLGTTVGNGANYLDNGDIVTYCYCIVPKGGSK